MFSYIILVDFYCSLVGVLATAPRQLWSFSRDKAVSGIYLSYLMVSILLLHRRLKGDISLYNSSDEDLSMCLVQNLVGGDFIALGSGVSWSTGAQ